MDQSNYDRGSYGRGRSRGGGRGGDGFGYGRGRGGRGGDGDGSGRGRGGRGGDGDGSGRGHRGGRGGDFYGRGRGDGGGEEYSGFRGSGGYPRGGRGEEYFGGRGSGDGGGEEYSGGRGSGGYPRGGRVEEYSGGRGSGGYPRGGRGEEYSGGRGSGGYPRGGGGRGNQYPQQYNQPQGQYGRGSGSGGGGGGGQQYNRSRADHVRGEAVPEPGVRTWAGIAAPQHADSQILTQTQSGIADIRIQEVSKSSQQPASSSKGGVGKELTPIRRPDNGGTIASRKINLLVNHFPVKFNPSTIILHYDVEVKRVGSRDDGPVKKSILKSDLRLIREKLCYDQPDLFPLLKTAYDGEKNIFSAVRLPAGTYKVELLDGGNTKGRSYEFTIKHVGEVRLSKLKDYLSGNLLQIPREVLQGMDLVMKENLFREKVSVGKNGRGFYPREFKPEDDLYCGVAAFKGFQESLKTTSNGLAMCLDYSVLAFRKRIAVLDYLKERIPDFRGAEDVNRFLREVTLELRGLKVTVTHRRTKQKYTIAGLTNEITRDISFKLEDPEGEREPENVSLLAYFEEKWGKEIEYKDIPCLEVGKSNRSNSLPMEFCVLADDRRFPTDLLSRDADKKLKDLSLLQPKFRRDEIQRMVQKEYGPASNGKAVIQNFEFEVGMNMTQVSGRVMPPPYLKIGTPNGNTSSLAVDKFKCHWNLVGGKTVVHGQSADRWALIDFSSGRCRTNYFIDKLMNRCQSLGVPMADPLVVRFTNMREFSSVDKLHRLLSGVVTEAARITNEKLQIIVCVMAGKDDGYKSLKWVSETKIGVITQCCLANAVNKANDQFLANLGLKINAKLGGSNVELNDRLRCFAPNDHFMFIGADVNHPAPANKLSPSIAAVVGSVNWPAATCYAARVSPQRHRKEEIESFGSMCFDLVKTYENLNGRKPNKIVVFRDGVSDAQFLMVLNNELADLMAAFDRQNYHPAITLVVAQKRHTTRLFPANEPGNVPPGTVVDQGIIHPLEFDFYLNSHFGGLGTSKSTHYSVLWDGNGFSSDRMQELIYHLCFTFARCTKPISLVPPVYYADLVAYRGRMFQEVATDVDPEGGSSFNQVFYDLEPLLKDRMFFV